MQCYKAYLIYMEVFNEMVRDPSWGFDFPGGLCLAEVLLGLLRVAIILRQYKNLFIWIANIP